MKILLGSRPSFKHFWKHLRHLDIAEAIPRDVTFCPILEIVTQFKQKTT
jgi:hypothetical protein